MEESTWFSNWGLVIGVCIFMIIVLGWYSYEGFKAYYNFNNSLDEIYDKLKALQEKVVPVYDDLGTDDQLVSGSKGIYSEICQVLSGTILETELRTMEEFVWGASKSNSAETSIFLTKSVYEICDSSDFSENRIFLTSIKNTPVMATGLGLLGTFFGLTYGLMSANTGDNTKEIISGVKQMLSGSGSAFSTSFVGIIISLCLTGWMNKRREKITAKYMDILSIVDQLIPVKSYEVLVAEQVSIAKEEKEDLKRVFESMVENLCHGMSDVYKSDLVPYFDRMETNMGQITTKLDSVNEHLNRISQSAGNAVGEAVANATSNEIKELSRVISDVKAIVEASGGSAKDIIERQTKLLDNMKSYMESGNQAMETTTDAIIKKMQGMSESMMEQTKAMADMMQTKTEKATTELTEKMVEAAKRIADSGNTITESMEKALKDILADIAKSQQGLGAKVEKMATDMDNITEKLVGSSYDMFEDITTMVRKLVENIKVSMESVKGIADEVEASMKHISKGHTVLDDATKELKVTIGKVQKYQREYVQKMTDFADKVESVSRTANESASKMVEHLQKYQKEYLELATSMNITMNKATTRIESMQDYLGKSALQIQENMQSKLADINDATEEVLRAFDQHTASLCEEFNSVVRAIGDTSESFIDHMNKLSADKVKGRRE